MLNTQTHPKLHFLNDSFATLQLNIPAIITVAPYFKQERQYTKRKYGWNGWLMCVAVSGGGMGCRKISYVNLCPHLTPQPGAPSLLSDWLCSNKADDDNAQTITNEAMALATTCCSSHVGKKQNGILYLLRISHTSSIYFVMYKE